METTNHKTETKRILLFLVITFSLTWAYCLAVVYPLLRGGTLAGLPPIAAQLAVAAAMFFPSVGVLLTRLLTKEGLQSAWLHPHFKGNLKMYLAAWFGPGILTLLGAGLYFLLFPQQFDPSLGYFSATLASAGADMSTLPIPLPALMLIQTAQAFFLAPVMNFVNCFGEEWGWRGYLLPKMAAKLPPIPTLLVTGVIWGLWHAPLTIAGHNYGMGYPGYPFTGIAAMCGFCIVMGIFLSWLTLKTRSCIPAVLAHGAINGIAAIGIYLTFDGGNPFIGPAPTGIVGVLPFLAVAAVLCLTYFRKRRAA
ncbi:MAG: CPBP family intramembrane metalloprotease [Ruminococcaceae bacterium]|nr:CPBP family intramembrane metalloprotease [Oscillospiraceae bacterium]